MTQLNPKLIKRIHELKAEGLSSRGIEAALAKDGIVYSHTSIATVIRTTMRPPEKSAKPKDPPKGKRADPAVMAEVLGDVEDDAPIDVVKGRLASVREIITKLRPEVEAGDYDAGKWGTLVKLEADLAKRIVALTPTAAPDPAADPFNIGARQLIVETVRANVHAILKRHGIDPDAANG
jgi:hypothetical protein